MNNEFVQRVTEAITLRLAHDYNFDPVEALHKAYDELEVYFGKAMNISKLVYQGKDYMILWDSSSHGTLYPWNKTHETKDIPWSTSKPVGTIDNNVVTLV